MFLSSRHWIRKRMITSSMINVFSRFFFFSNSFGKSKVDSSLLFVQFHFVSIYVVEPRQFDRKKRWSHWYRKSPIISNISTVRFHRRSTLVLIEFLTIMFQFHLLIMFSISNVLTMKSELFNNFDVSWLNVGTTVSSMPWLIFVSFTVKRRRYSPLLCFCAELDSTNFFVIRF